MAKVQLDLDFEPGLTESYPSLRDLMAAIIYAHRGGLKAIAAELDISASHLSRSLSRNDPDDRRHFDVDWIAVVIQATGDNRPVSWLIEKFMEDPEFKRKQTIERVAQVLPLLTELVSQEVKREAVLLRQVAPGERG